MHVLNKRFLVISSLFRLEKHSSSEVPFEVSSGLYRFLLLGLSWSDVESGLWFGREISWDTSLTVLLYKKKLGRGAIGSVSAS